MYVLFQIDEGLNCPPPPPGVPGYMVFRQKKSLFTSVHFSCSNNANANSILKILYLSLERLIQVNYLQIYKIFIQRNACVKFSFVKIALIHIYPNPPSPPPHPFIPMWFLPSIEQFCYKSIDLTDNYAEWLTELKLRRNDLTKLLKALRG